MTQQTDGETKTILLADDEPAIVRLVSAILSKHGYNVLEAQSSDAALQASEEYSGRIHLLLSNIQMPGITGIELGTKIVTRRPETKVMLMSGFADGLLVLNEGWHFLNKPFIPSQLIALITEALKDPFPIEDLNEH